MFFSFFYALASLFFSYFVFACTFISLSLVKQKGKTFYSGTKTKKIFLFFFGFQNYVN